MAEYGGPNAPPHPISAADAMPLLLRLGGDGGTAAPVSLALVSGAGSVDGAEGFVSGLAESFPDGVGGGVSAAVAAAELTKTRPS